MTKKYSVRTSVEARENLLLTIELPGVCYGQARCVIQACVAELYGLFFSCSARIMRAMPDSRAASSRV
jgi:hypothetical protein